METEILNHKWIGPHSDWVERSVEAVVESQFRYPDGRVTTHMLKCVWRINDAHVGDEATGWWINHSGFEGTERPVTPLPLNWALITWRRSSKVEH